MSFLQAFFSKDGSNFSLNSEQVLDKKAVEKKDCAEWVTKTNLFFWCFLFTFLCCYHKHFSKKSKTFIVQMGKVEKKVVLVA